MNPREAADFLAGLTRTPDTRTNVERRALAVLIDHARATSLEPIDVSDDRPVTEDAPMPAPAVAAPPREDDPPEEAVGAAIEAYLAADSNETLSFPEDHVRAAVTAAWHAAPGTMRDPERAS